MSHQYQYRDSSGLARLLLFLLGTGVVLSALSMASSFMQLDLINRGGFADAEAEANDLRERVLGVCQLALSLTTTVVFGIWIVRANRNVRALGAENLTYTPGWALGYFFIPIVNLWKPYQAMTELWHASHQLHDWKQRPASSLLALWWAFWILANIVGQLALRMSMAATSLPAMKAATVMDIVSDCFFLPACFCAGLVVRKITRAQRDHLQSLMDGASADGAGPL